MNIYNSTRSLYNLKLQTNMMFGLPYTPLPNTTLNEKFNILQYKQTACADGKFPVINGLVIGNGGKEIIDADIINLKMGKHSPVDAALYNHIPWVIRPVDDDLLDFDRSKYRLRVEEYIGGVKYALYYMKLINKDDIWYRPEIFFIDNSDIIPSIKKFSTYRDDLLTPSADNNNSIIDNENTVYGINVIQVPYDLTVNDLEELDNVFNTLNITDRLITELGITTGVDYEIEEGIYESVLTQIGFFLDVSLDLQMIDSNEVKFTIELGGGELLPLRKDIYKVCDEDSRC